jgi:hypothetical protein
MMPSPVKLPTVPPNCSTAAAACSTSSAMISRRRSAPTAAARSIERTTSAKRTVTCLYSAEGVACAAGEPHSLQNLAVRPKSAPHDPQERPTALTAPLPSTPLLSVSRSEECGGSFGR